MCGYGKCHGSRAAIIDSWHAFRDDPARDNEQGTNDAMRREVERRGYREERDEDDILGEVGSQGGIQLSPDHERQVSYDFFIIILSFSISVSLSLAVSLCLSLPLSLRF